MEEIKTSKEGGSRYGQGAVDSMRPRSSLKYH